MIFIIIITTTIIVINIIIINYSPLTNSFITDVRLVKVRIAMRAEGSCVRKRRRFSLNVGPCSSSFSLLSQMNV